MQPTAGSADSTAITASMAATPAPAKKKGALAQWMDDRERERQEHEGRKMEKMNEIYTKRLRESSAKKIREEEDRKRREEEEF